MVQLRADFCLHAFLTKNHLFLALTQIVNSYFLETESCHLALSMFLSTSGMNLVALLRESFVKSILKSFCLDILKSPVFIDKNTLLAHFFVYLFLFLSVALLYF